MGMNTSVFEMVHQVLGDAKEKLAASKGVEKTAAVKSQPFTKQAGETAPSKLSNEYLGKLASACDHLAENLHLIDHQRTPAEKLAEYAAINEALLKRASEGGDVGKGPHQTNKSNSESDPPATVGTDDSGTAVGAGNAIPSEATNTPGVGVMDADQSGESTKANQPPKVTAPTEKPNPQDASNAMPTNKGMMMPEQPEDLLRQPGGDVSTGSKTASERAQRVLGRVTGQYDRELRQKIAADKKVRVLMAKAAEAGIPLKVAAAMIQKAAADADNPATISAGTEPVLQSVSGVPSPLMQGSEAGEQTPRATAPTSGEGGGRELLGSVEAAINATKHDAKKQNKGALSELLTEPMQSAKHDKTLQVSLDNTSSAGVKISAARELLKKLAASSPEFRRKVATLAKQAEGEGAMPPEVAGGAEPPAEPVTEPVPGTEEEGMNPAALEAVLAGVTPEDVAVAEELLAGEAGAGEEPEANPEAAPQAGAGDQEKLQQFGGAAMPSAGTASAPSSPTPMMA